MSPTPNLEAMIASAQEAPAFFDKESKKGDSITGFISFVDVRQTRDPATGKLQWWDDAGDGSDTRPMEQLVIILEPENGEAPATVYVKWWGAQRKAFAAAVLNAGLKAPQVGNLLKVTYEGEGAKPTNAALNAPKIYAYALNAGKAA